MIRRVVFACLFGGAALLAEASQDGESASASRTLNPRRVSRSVPLIDGHDLQFKRMSAQGLTQTRVAQIVQDEKGFMWFGTQDGLHRYDGYSLTVFRHDPRRRNSLGGVYVYSLLRDRANTLWVGSDDGLDRFQPGTETFTSFDIAPDGDGSSASNVSCIDQDSEGTIWLCTRNGLYRLDPGAQRPTLIGHDPNDASTLSARSVQFVGEDARGALWIGTSAGLDQLDRGTRKVIRHLRLSESQGGMSFHEDRSGTFWIIHGAEGQLSVLDQAANELSTWQPAASGADTSPVLFSIMLEDRDGTMWFGTRNHGILKYDRMQRRFIRYTTHAADPHSLPDRRVNVLYQDQEGLIWAGLHQAAPNYFLPRPPAFQRLQPPSRQSAMVSAILRDRAGVVWLGLDRGMMTLDRNDWRYQEHPELRGDETTSMVESEPGVFWIGTAGHGLRRYDRRTGRLTKYRHDPAASTSLPSDFVEQVRLDRNGAVWAVTWGGLARWDPALDHFTTYMPPDAPSGLTLHTAAFGRDGVIWIGSNLGLHRVDSSLARAQWFRYDRRNPRSLSNDRVNAIHEAADGSVWIGTQNGLDHWDASGRPLGRFAEGDGLPGNTVSCILEDDSHALWISTNRGISRLDPATGRVRSYGTADGLPGINMTGWGGCSKTSSDGEMLFAGFSGAISFFPGRIGEREYTPPVALTRLGLLGPASEVDTHPSPVTAISYASGLRLLPSQNKFSIEFAALSFLSPETNRFRYRMQGLQDEWTEVGSNQRVATYLALPAGDYSFQVLGATSHGPWSSSAATLSIVMLPPWWNSAPFYIVVGFAVVAALSLGYRLRVRQLAHAYNVRLEERWSERTRIARELHDTMLQSFQGLMFRLQAVRNLLPEKPEGAISVLDIALAQGEDAIDQARSAVGGLRASETVDGNMESGLTAIAAATVHLCPKGEEPSWGVVVRGRVREIPQTVLYELYRVTREALSNAFRHARAGTIAVEVHYDADALRISVVDDGVGLDEASLNSDRSRKHWGLLGMKERVEKLGGRMSLGGGPGQGTAVSVTIPAAVAYHEGSVLDRLRARLSFGPRPRSASYD